MLLERTESTFFGSGAVGMMRIVVEGVSTTVHSSSISVVTINWVTWCARDFMGHGFFFFFYECRLKQKIYMHTYIKLNKSSCNYIH